MTTDELARRVKAYYDAQQPSDDALARLRLAAEMERAAQADRRARRDARPLVSPRRSGKRFAPRPRRLLAAALVALVTAPAVVVAVGAAQGRLGAWTDNLVGGRHQPAIIALWFHAEWSEASRTLAPLVERLSGQFRDDDVQFVKLDLTDEVTEAEARAVARRLGVEQFYVAQNGQTGEVILIDSASGRRVGELKPTQNFERMYGAVQRATIERGN